MMRLYKLRVPESTTRLYLKKLNGNEITYKKVFRDQKKLLTADLIKILQDIICRRDQNNTGLTRKEYVKIIMDLGGAKSFKAAENHFDYLIRKGQLTQLNRGGKVITAQATTTERCNITVKQQYRWHTLIDSIWEDMRVTNTPENEFKKVRKHFQLNVDEACFMVSNGKLKIVAGRGKKRHDKNVSDDRTSITVVRCGNAAGNNGPVIFLLKGGDAVRKSRYIKKHTVTGVWNMCTAYQRFQQC